MIRNLIVIAIFAISLSEGMKPRRKMPGLNYYWYGEAQGTQDCSYESRTREHGPGEPSKWVIERRRLKNPAELCKTVRRVREREHLAVLA